MLIHITLIKIKLYKFLLVDYLDNTAIQNGFDSYKDMLERGFSIDYSISLKIFIIKTILTFMKCVIQMN